MVGQTISHYKITAKLGEGGMGVVYKAEDTKLDRPVALKFLAAHLVEEQEARDRFTREAKAAAALDHPNICTVHEIDEAVGRTLLAMAYIEGRTVKDKVKQRPLKIEEALDIAVQSARGLLAAHKKGVVHRDIKSANLMVTPEGVVKIMDFGLAQLAQHSQLTKTATILGTPAYMSPEQARRERADRRADIWSLGVVIYEMVTGRLPFEGERQEAVLYAIANEEPEPITALRAGLPMELERIVAKSLAKDREDRYQHVEDMLVDLRRLSKELSAGTSVAVPASVGVEQAAAEALGSLTAGNRRSSSSAPPDEKRRAGTWVPWVLFAAALGVIVVMGLWSEAVPEIPLRRFSFTAGSDVRYALISPNGRHIVYQRGGVLGTQARLWVRDLDRDEPRELGEGASPFWSPDSEYVGFFTGEELRKVPIEGGPALRVCALPTSEPFGFPSGAWSPEGERILFNIGQGLHEVSSKGGTPKLLLVPQNDRRWGLRMFPAASGSSLVLFGRGSYGEDQDLVIHDLESGDEEVPTRGRDPFVSAGGHVLYSSRNSGILAFPFAFQTGKAAGEPFAVTARGRFPSVANDGTLVYLEQGETRNSIVVSRDREGRKLETLGQTAGPIDSVSRSPNGDLVAVEANVEGNLDVWVVEVARAVPTRFTFGRNNDGMAVWSPNGNRIACFSRRREENADTYVKSSDGGGEARPVVATELDEWPSDWSGDGKYLLCSINDPKSGFDIAYLKIDDKGEREAVRFLHTEFAEKAARFSPDGRFVAYESTESGRYEVYVQAFPDGGGKRQVSSGGGNDPRWRKDGKELYYRSEAELFAVPVTLSPNFSMGAPKSLFQDESLLQGALWGRYDVSPDGERFYLRESVGEGQEPVIRVVQNWFSEFRDRQ